MTEIVIVSNRFPMLGRQIDSLLEDALDIGVLTCIEVADPLTRVDTGALRANKTIERSTGERTVTWNQDYSAFQDQGTVFMSGTHYAERGMDAATPVVADRLGRFGS